jgi:D-alanyl-D-alanine carboxypeptidase
MSKTMSRRVGTVVPGVLAATSIAACASSSLTPLTPLTPHPVRTPTHAASATANQAAVAPHARFVRMTDSLFSASQFRTATWGALVVTSRGDTVYARNAAALMTPASNMKIITGAVALVRLGVDFRFREGASVLVTRDTVPRDFGPMYDTTAARTAPMSDLLSRMLKPSQNRLAEQLFYTTGLEATGIVSRDSAAAVERRQLASWGIPLDGAIVRDGSGYDRGNYLSPETIVRVLTLMRNDTRFPVWFNALSVAGVDGTLASRLRATAAERNAHAKTGSLGAVRALSGYVTTAGGEQLTFSIICNGFTTPADSVTRTIDRVVADLASLQAVQ